MPPFCCRWVEFLLQIPCIQGEVVGSLEERKKKVRALDGDLRLLLLALKDIFYRKKVCQQLVPEAFNENGWLAALLDVVFQAMETLENKSAALPAARAWPEAETLRQKTRSRSVHSVFLV